jgi:uncharacterized protein (TIGR04255 family)
MYSESVSTEGWSRAPLIFVMAQCVTDPNDALERQLPDLQIALSKVGFSARTQRNVERLQINVQTGMVNTESSVIHEYAKPDQSYVVQISRNQIDFSTSRYSRFENFYKEFASVLNAIQNATAQENFISRLGLRYLDWLTGHPDMALEKQIVPRFHVPLDQQSERVTGVMQLQLLRGDMNLLYQSMTGLHARQHLAVFSGVRPSIERLNGFDPNEPFHELVCDFDAFQIFDTQQPRVSLQTTLDLIGNLHNFASEAFRRSVTPDAIEFYK